MKFGNYIKEVFGEEPVVLIIELRQGQCKYFESENTYIDIKPKLLSALKANLNEDLFFSLATDFQKGKEKATDHFRKVWNLSNLALVFFMDENVVYLYDNQKIKEVFDFDTKEFKSVSK